MNHRLASTFLLCLLAVPVPCRAFDSQLSGHLRGQSTLAKYRDNHILSRVEDRDSFIDGSLDLRLNGELFLSDNVSFSLAYELAGSGGQSRRAISKLPAAGGLSPLFATATPSDDRQLFDLTRILSDGDSQVIYNRIDRLVLSFNSDYGTLKLGRQALTWGNGLIFNPADLVNPFGPADIIRDYKTGSDMLLYQHGGTLLSDFQLAYVPRRSLEDGELEGAQATFGSKVRFSANELDLDLLALYHYQDMVIGAGLTGFLGGAVYRTDWTLTFLQDDPNHESYVSAVANLDYSWVLQNKNWYGSVELYYNGLGADSPEEALADAALMERFSRGELFVTGKWYLDSTLQYEAHPLLNCFVSMIYNVRDQSFLLQPRLVWDMSQSTQLLTGVNLPIGSLGDEFGHLEDMQTGTSSGPAIQGYLVISWFF